MSTPRPLSAIADINPPPPFLPGDDEPVSFLPMAAVGSDGEGFRVESREYADVAKGYTPFAQGDVLLAKITPCFENGKLAHIDELPGGVGFGSTEFHVVRPRDGVDGRFLYHMLRSPRFRAEGTRRMTGSAGQQRVSTQFLRDYPILVPQESTEQRRIVSILDKADAIRASRRAALADADSLARATFLDKFGDPLTNPKRLPTCPLHELGRVVTGNTPPRANAAYYGTAIEWTKSDNINTPSHFLTRATERLSEAGAAVGRVVPAGSILVTCIAGSPGCIGNAAIADRQTAFNQQINAIVPHRGGDTGFVYGHLLVGKKLVQLASTNSMKGMVSKSQFEKVSFLKPPEQDREAFSDKFAKVLALHERCAAAVADADTLYAALAARAFRGEL